MTSRQLDRHRREWEEFGRLDPLWAVLSVRTRQFGKWDPDEFFATGEEWLRQRLQSAVRLGYPRRWGAALDFGCGVGRVTRAMARRFEHCYGVDISATMTAKAQQLNAAVPNCTFLVNHRSDLKGFADESFDLVYSEIVLQHQPSKQTVQAYLAEFLRVLRRDGLLVFQLPTRIPMKLRLQPRRRLYSFMRALGFKEDFLYHRLGVYPMRMMAVPEPEVRDFLTAVGGRVLEVQADGHGGPSVESRTYFVTREPA